VIDDDNAPPSLRPRFDYAVRLQGPTVCAVHANVRRLWEIVSWASFRHRYRLPAATPEHCAIAGVQKAAFLVRDNLRQRNTIANAYLDAIQQAQGEIIIANAYFMPGWRFRHALRQAARRGVRITILLQGKTDHPLMHYATQALYGSLLKEGMQIFEYRRSFLHAKVAVVDGNWTTVGSSNIDPFSLLLAREGNIVVDDTAFAATLRQRLGQAIADGAQAITSADVEHAGWLRRLLRWCSYGLVRSLVGIVGYSPLYWHDEHAREQEQTEDGT
jgi:cardiolipin synthase A/B